MAISLLSNHEIKLSGSGEATWGIPLSDIATKINNVVPDNAEITKITLNFSGKSYNNNILGAMSEYAICGLTNSDSEAASNTNGGTGGTNLFKYGPYEIGGKSTVNLQSQSVDITKYFNARTPHSVQNTSYSRLTLAFTSKNYYNKTHTVSLSLDVTYHTHSYTSTVTKQPTCETAGETTYTCSCGDSYVDKTKPMALGHSWVDATCTAPKTCLRCGVTEGSALSHNYYVEEVTAPPDDRGHTKYTCSRCGHSYYDNYTYPIELKTYKTANDGGYEGGGSIIGVANGEHCEVGKTLTLTAVPDSGYAFSHWEKIAEAGVVDAGTDNPLVITQPNSFLVVYAFFKKEPKITSVQMLYQNQQISETNKVLANQFFRIVVGVE
jgi:hypothetical protein